MSTDGLTVSTVESGSIADELRLAAGDVILSIDGHPVRDIIDYRFNLPGEHLEVLVRKSDGQEWLLEIDKDYAEDLGLSFAVPFSRLRRCSNDCVFCFLKQMPRGLRASLYFNDDDYRLSFWEGNFTTLTNAGPDDLERIVTQRLSPLYISVHATDPSLRTQMLKHPRAGRIMEQLCFLAEHGITMHTQVVLCQGINDGEALNKTVQDLASLTPAVRSIAVVPVGLTRFRSGLSLLRGWDGRGAQRIVTAVRMWQQEFQRRYAMPLVYAGDEFYLLAQAPVPEREAYADFPQLENGIGMVRLFLDEAEQVFTAQGFSSGRQKSAIVVTGMLARKLMQDFAAKMKRLGGPLLTVLPVQNKFFGAQVTVAGLLTAQDVIAAVQSIPHYDRPVIVPSSMFNDDGLTIDNHTLADLCTDLETEVYRATGPRDMARLLEQLNH